ncbi:MAG: tetratricopeptide repeat protein [Polyangia bacterium]|nr:tetratricopeptide repeat protein [Polyangia bacterium]
MAINKNKVIAAAQKFVQKGQLDKAIREYLRVVEEEPGDVRTWLKIGDLQLKVGASGDATATYLKVANTYSQEGFYLKAVAVYKQVLRLQPEFVEVHFKLAALNKQLGLISDARRQLETAFQLLVKAGRTEESHQVLSAMVEMDPENVAARIRLAEVHSKEKRVEEAIAEFTRAADVLRSSGRTDDFLRVAERIIWHKADNIPFIKEVASLYLERQDPRRALQKLQVCYKADEKDTETMALLVKAFIALEQPEKAVTILKVLASVHEEKGELDQRDEVFRRILMLAPDDREARDALREATGVSALVVPTDAYEPRPVPAPAPAPLQPEPPVEEEIEEIEEIAEIDAFEELGEEDETASQIATLYGEAEVYEKFGLLQEAVDQLERAKQLEPDNLETQLRLKELFVKLDRTDDAVAAILVVAGSKMDSEPEEAAALLRQALELDSNNRRARDMLADLPGAEPAPRPRRSSMHLASRWQRAESDSQIMDDIAAAAFAEQPVFATEEIDIDALERDLEDRGPFPSGRFRPVMTEAEGKNQRHPDGAPDPYGDAGLEYLEEGVGPSVLGTEDELEVDFSSLAEDLEGLEPQEYRRAGDPDFQSGPGMDTAIVSHDRFAHIAAGLDGDDDDEPLDLGREPSGVGMGPEDLFQDELRQLEEAEQLVASITSDKLQALERPGQPARASGSPGPDYGQDLQDEAQEVMLPPEESDRPRAAQEVPEALAEEMAEADFFINQGLLEDAIGMLRDLIDEHGEHPALMAKIAGLTAQLHGEEEGDGVFDDLDVEGAFSGLSEDGSQEDHADAAPAFRPHVPTKEADAFSQFKEGVARQVGEDDADTHFDVGIAYREMGMLRDAINEFRTAMRAHNEVQCHLMIALCHRDLGEQSEAINIYKKALYCERITEAEQVDIYYQMGLTYESLSDPQEALYYYEKVSRMASSYRDVVERRDALKSALDSSRAAGQKGVDSAFDDLIDQS